MKIAIIGKGTASIINTLVLLENNHNVTVYFDPNTPHINVGESTTPIIGNLIYRTLGLSIHDLVDSKLFSYKMGINFINWGKGKQFYQFWEDNNIAHHFLTEKFNTFIQDYLSKYKDVKYIPKKVSKVIKKNDKVIIGKDKYDFLINCSGWNNDNNYYDPMIETVNSAWLFKKEYENYDDNYTLHLATKDGWQFGLPYSNSKLFRCGYLFNDKITSKEEAFKNLPKNAQVSRHIKWKPKYRKTLIDDKLTSYNGNRLFFFEPLQALTLHFVYEFSLLISNYLNERTKKNLDENNKHYNELIYANQLCLAYHYQFGSKYKTPFWNNIKKLSKDIMKSTYRGTDEKFLEFIKFDMKYKDTSSNLGSMTYIDHIQLQTGFLADKILWE